MHFYFCFAIWDEWIRISYVKDPYICQKIGNHIKSRPNKKRDASHKPAKTNLAVWGGSGRSTNPWFFEDEGFASIHALIGLCLKWGRGGGEGR